MEASTTTAVEPATVETAATRPFTKTRKNVLGLQLVVVTGACDYASCSLLNEPVTVERIVAQGQEPQSYTCRFQWCCGVFSSPHLTFPLRGGSVYLIIQELWPRVSY